MVARLSITEKRFLRGNRWEKPQCLSHAVHADLAQLVEQCYGPERDQTILYADVAQLVEQRYRKPQVVGSIPTIGSRHKRLSDGNRTVERSEIPVRGSSVQIRQSAHQAQLDHKSAELTHFFAINRYGHTKKIPSSRRYHS